MTLEAIEAYDGLFSVGYRAYAGGIKAYGLCPGASLASEYPRHDRHRIAGRRGDQSLAQARSGGRGM